MKNISVLFCFLSVNIALHCMEQVGQDADYKKTEKILGDDCKLQIKTCLEKSKGDNFTPQYMNNILEVISFIAACDNGVEYIHTARDDKQNGFFQYALEEVNWPVMQWLLTKENIKYHLEKECADFVTFCDEQLSPSKEEKELLLTEEEEKKKELLSNKEWLSILEEKKKRRNNAYLILKAVIEHYKTNTIFQSRKESYIKTIIMLQIKHEACGTKFVIEEELLMPFLTQEEAVDMYQSTVGENNNTLAHFVTKQHDADKLCMLIKKNYVSRTIKNNDDENDKKTVLMLAFNKHRVFTRDTSLIDLYSEEARETRCCYFMLDKYFTENMKDFEKRPNCCNKHVITKKVVEELPKKKDSFIEKNNSDKPAVTTALKSLFLPDPEESQCARCCFQLLNWLKIKPEDWEALARSGTTWC